MFTWNLKYAYALVGIAIVIVGAISMSIFNTNKNSFDEVTAKLSELQADPSLEVATFAGGCFWCMEGPFEQEEGVAAAIAGFAGGEVPNPSYEQVITGNTGHREAVQIYFDPSKISYQKLLDIYWLQIDPTDPGGQFADRGEQYTTAIFYHSPAQEELALKSKETLDAGERYEEPIVTEILAYTNFFPAEDYHQNFYLQNKNYYERYNLFSGRKEYVDAIKKRVGQ